MDDSLKSREMFFLLEYGLLTLFKGGFGVCKYYFIIVVFLLERGNLFVFFGE
jgi:hypothetical protein